MNSHGGLLSQDRQDDRFWLMKTSSLSNWPNPLTGDHLAELGRVVGAEAPLLMISHKHSLRTLMAVSLGPLPARSNSCRPY